MHIPTLFNEGWLDKSCGHQIYYAEYGNPTGEAIVLFHGGPGSFGKPKQANLFDLEKYRVIIFDQRGCGKSKAKDALSNNITSDTIADAERLREELNISSWFVCGGSWGSTLALVYAIKHPRLVKGLLLSGIFLADRKAIAWSLGEGDGIKAMFPDVWEEYRAALKTHQATPENMATVFGQKLKTADLGTKQAIAGAVLNWEHNVSSNLSDVVYRSPVDIGEPEIASVSIFLHYMANRCFIPDGYIINNVVKLTHTPIVMVHGRYDLLCLYEGAWQLKQQLPKSKLVTIPQGSHLLSADGWVAQKYIFDSFLKDHA